MVDAETDKIRDKTGDFQGHPNICRFESCPIHILNKKEGTKMYVYLNSESRLWTVGFYGPMGEWHPESDHRSSEDAANRVAFLNGKIKEETNERI